ncbi:hypothetical protein FCIRC_12884 [Fusarium circinatum]|uniref:Uncharacterized protein n=1 Tax=Fusarium circinatum TaxID=48490 RepID=A0A8H5SRB0_FUSCI|nr:hypothetical protein FCIRC_12884 [Fusarium circinatum]
MPTLLEALTKRNVTVSSQAIVGGSNTTTETYIEPSGWRTWDEFNYDILTRIFRRKLASDYRASSEPRALELDLIANNEETLEDMLKRFVSPCVNYALEHQQGHPHLGRGSRCGFEDRPDWSTISTEYITEHGQFAGILPGDIKLDAKYRTRYGFVITDADLVVLRITRATKAELSQGDHLLLEPHDMIWEGGAHDTQTKDADDLPQPTRTDCECSVDPSGACQRDELEASVGGSSRQADQDQDDDD